MQIEMVTESLIPTVTEFIAGLTQDLAPGTLPDLVAMTATAQELIGTPAITGFVAPQRDSLVGVVMLIECAAVYAGGRFGEIK